MTRPKLLKLIIAGGRDFVNYHLLEMICDKLLTYREPKEVIILCGKARGADTLGEKYAKKKGIRVKYFPADWDTYGLGAGPIRNQEMADYANACLCFWDGRSKGTRDMINRATEKGLRLKVVNY